MASCIVGAESGFIKREDGKQTGVAIPPNVLARADKVIK
jgi:hypothetical protein